MASYDSPGHVDLGPAGPVTQSTVAGSGSADTPVPLTVAAETMLPPRGAVLGTQNLTGLSGNSVSEASPQTMGVVHAFDTQVPQQTDLYNGQDVNPLSGVPGDSVGYTTGGQATAGPYGVSHVVGDRHPGR